MNDSIRWHSRVDFRRIEVPYYIPTLWEDESARKRSISPEVKAARKKLRKWGAKSASLSGEKTKIGCVVYYEVLGHDAPKEISFCNWWCDQCPMKCRC